jgi:predicted nuclease of predicted toxin-antitoxin system
VRFLIDECLSPALVDEAREAGFEAYHLVHIGGASWADWRIAAYAVARDSVLVTNNRTDFQALYAQQEMHPGLVIIVPSVGREQQIRLFQIALNRLTDLSDLINKVLEVHLEPSRERLELYDFPLSPG